MPVKFYGEPYVHKFSGVNIFWNITHRQAISPVAKFDHLLGHGFMIQRVILILSNVSMSANQNQLFYMKVLYNVISWFCLQIEVDVIQEMTDEDLKKYLPCKGDRIAAKAFARGEENKNIKDERNLH